jgi:hypothetical protein
MLADRKGWATFIGTSKGKNEFWKADTTWLFAFVRRGFLQKLPKYGQALALNCTSH